MRQGREVWDTHTHLGKARHSGRECTADELLRAMDAHGVDCSVAIPFPVVEDYRAAHDEIGAAVRAHGDRLRGVACLYPFIPEAEFRDEVRRCREEYGFGALKLQPQYQPLNPLWPSSDFLFETALEHKLTLIIHTGAGIPYSLPSLYMPVARRYPELTIVLAHCGGGGLLVGEAIVAAMFCPNILLEMSTLMPNHILEVLQHVAPDRLMAGSDLPENLEIELSKIEMLPVSEETKRLMIGGAAARVYGGVPA
jgi:uncharacterized protein